MAFSAEDDPFRVDLREIVFHSDDENFHIEEYSKIFSNEIPKLFFDIHNYVEGNSFQTKGESI